MKRPTTEPYVALRSGALDGLRLVGFRGAVEPWETPAVCPPVVADEEGSEVVLCPGWGGRPADGMPLARVMRRATTAAIGPWPVRLDDVVVLLGPAELDRGRDMRAIAARLGVVDEIRRLLDWVEGSRRPDRGARCQPVGELAGWACSARAADSLLRVVADLASGDVTAALIARDSPAAIARAVWMLRASRSEPEALFAIAALYAAGDPEWKRLLAWLLPDRSVEDLEQALRPFVRLLRESLSFSLPPGGIVLERVIGGYEKELVRQALAQAGDNRAAAARLLGLNRTTLVEKLKRWKAETDEPQPAEDKPARPRRGARR